MVCLPSGSSDSYFRSISAGGSASELASVPTQRRCGYTINVLTSMTRKNPGRRFYTCPIHSDGDVGCDIWKWVDPALSNHYLSMMNDLLNTRGHLLDERGSLQRALMVKDAELGHLKEECDAMSRRIGNLVAEGGLKLAPEAIESEQLPVENHHLRRRHVFAAVAVLLVAFAMLIFK